MGKDKEHKEKEKKIRFDLDILFFIGFILFILVMIFLAIWYFSSLAGSTFIGSMLVLGVIILASFLGLFFSGCRE